MPKQSKPTKEQREPVASKKQNNTNFKELWNRGCSVLAIVVLAALAFRGVQTLVSGTQTVQAIIAVLVTVLLVKVALRA